MVEKIHKKMRTYPGFVSLRLIDPISKNDDAATANSQEEVYGAVFKFNNFTNMQAWLHSSDREDLLVQLQPLLNAPDSVVAASSRILPDAFTDALVPSNTAAPLRPPQKWKVNVITILSLYAVISMTSPHLPGLVTKMGVVSTYGQITINSLVNVFLNTYVAVPLSTTIVGHWLAKPRPVWAGAQPWKYLDQGFPPGARLPRLVVTLLFFAPLSVFWILNEMDGDVGSGDVDAPADPAIAI